jgi:hypothetical protein
MLPDGFATTAPGDQWPKRRQKAAILPIFISDDFHSIPA